MTRSGHEGIKFHRELARLLPPAASVLDLACRDGTFLREALLAGARRAIGVEMSEEGLLACVAAGLTVYQGDITEGLADYPESSFDCVSLVRALGLLAQPEAVLAEMLRVGRVGLVTFDNLGHWRRRLRFLLRGSVPGTFARRLGGSPCRLTHSSLKSYCRDQGLAVLRVRPFPDGILARMLPSLFAQELAVVLAKEGGGRRMG